ncbi:glycosyl transferase family 25 [Vibrio crassostreae]|uniref:glycosyltransferase family 25 protein n=1 Tax=Vibrio crassostreae TaxID=246167 RepID=UPI000F4810ED|nr:glycosyltransferase family 25 protein [Vibrio crassostreae]ROO66137.1 glycosyl transferase family 25 [Vibrio crassostreae]ROP03175.1 glycosyl transferase family 25 [Vibrio crassostreae]ROQ72058.1 glycosyl transferase family 25 [Vibrio crassostreae]ROR77667.1 glycosyl transferase family 25 [Vibrio crassostreae]RPE88084.1 glycosyl transferase family 25 [Vibrio crassostreae]
MTKIFVINLESSTDRKENISRQLDELSLPFEFFSAIDGRTSPPHPLLKRYNDELSQTYRAKTLNAGQLGCYASHFLLWEKCIELNQPIIIIEDDALLFKKTFLDFLQDIPELPESIECIRLFNNKRRKFSSYSTFECSSTSIHKFTKGHMSTTAYYLTPEGAHKLLLHSKEWYMAVDIYMDRFWANEVECYGTAAPCLTNDPKFDSEIGYAKRTTTRSFIKKCKREYFNLSETIQRHLHNIKFKISIKKQ